MPDRIPTRWVRLIASGDLMHINASDFDPTQHDDPETTATEAEQHLPARDLDDRPSLRPKKARAPTKTP
jgi:hypothetical protein